MKLKITVQSVTLLQLRNSQHIESKFLVPTRLNHGHEPTVRMSRGAAERVWVEPLKCAIPFSPVALSDSLRQDICIVDYNHVRISSISTPDGCCPRYRRHRRSSSASCYLAPERSFCRVAPALRWPWASWEDGTWIWIHHSAPGKRPPS